MRAQFVELLVKARASNPNILLLTGDLGWKVLDSFEDTFAESYLNVGVAEQNMIGVAAGLAYEDFKPFVYSIGNFPSFRCLEQIRNDVSQHKLDVNIISVGSGFSYGALGYSHHAIEDIAALRCLPNIEIFCPAIPQELDWAFEQLIISSNPSYTKIPKESGFNVPSLNMVQHHEGIFQYRSGAQIALMSTGPILKNVLEAADGLESIGYNVSVYSFSQVKPFPDLSMLHRYSGVVSIEEHTIYGGFGSSLLEAMSHSHIYIPTLLLGTNTSLNNSVGSENYLRKLHHLDSESIFRRVTEWLER